MKTSQVYTLFYNTGAESVGTTKSQGRTKHYTVVYVITNAREEDVEKFESLWPFGNVELRKDNILRAEYIVKPDEVEEFCRLVKNIKCDGVNNEPTSIIRFQGIVPEGIKHKITDIIRSSDRVIFGKNQVAVVLANCNNVEATKSRIKQHFETEYERVLEKASPNLK